MRHIEINKEWNSRQPFVGETPQKAVQHYAKSSFTTVTNKYGLSFFKELLGVYPNPLTEKEYNSFLEEHVNKK